MKKIVISFGRMNPITVGHEKLVNKIKSVARKEKAEAALFLSHSQDKKKNPLKYLDKIRYATRAFGKVVKKSDARTIINVLQDLSGKYEDVTIIVGSDRVKEFDALVQRYNGKDYKFDTLKIVSAGERDPDSEGVDGMSGSKMRDLALTGKEKEFKSGLPVKLQKSKDGGDMYNKIREWGGITEDMSLEEALNAQQRMKKKMIMRRIKAKIKLGRRRAKFKMAKPAKLKIRAKKKARELIRQRIAGKQGKNYSSLPYASRQQIDKRMATKSGAIEKLAKKMLPKVRKGEQERLKSVRSAKKEELEVISRVYDEVLNETLSEKVKKNLKKKSEKYNVRYEDLKEAYLEYRNTMSAQETFDRINIDLINEDDKPNKRGDDAKGHKRPTEDGAGLTRAGAKAAGVKTAVTTKPSKLDPNGKAAKRRKSFCARMGGMKGPMKDEKGRPTRKAMSLRRWNC